MRHQIGERVTGIKKEGRSRNGENQDKCRNKKIYREGEGWTWGKNRMLVGSEG